MGCPRTADRAYLERLVTLLQQDAEGVVRAQPGANEPDGDLQELAAAAGRDLGDPVQQALPPN